MEDYLLTNQQPRALTSKKVLYSAQLPLSLGKGKSRQKSDCKAIVMSQYETDKAADFPVFEEMTRAYNSKHSNNSDAPFLQSPGSKGPNDAKLVNHSSLEKLNDTKNIKHMLQSIIQQQIPQANTTFNCSSGYLMNEQTLDPRSS